MSFLDRYLIKRFLKTFLFGFLAVLFLYILIDIVDLSRDLYHNKIPILLSLKYVSMSLPAAVNQLFPMLCLLSVLFTYGPMARRNELVALLSSGISPWRLIRGPMLIMVFLYALTLVQEQWVLPRTLPEARFLRNVVIKKKDDRRHNFYAASIFYGDQTLLRFGQAVLKTEPSDSFLFKNFVAYQISPDFKRLEGFLFAEKGSWDEQKKWVLHNERETFIRKNKILRKASRSIHPSLGFSLSEILPLLQSQKHSFSMNEGAEREASFSDILRTAANLHGFQGKSIRDLKRKLNVNFHFKASYGFASFGLFFLGILFLPLMGARQGHLLYPFLLSFISAFGFWFLLIIAKTMAAQGVLAPGITLWGMPIFLLCIGIYQYAVKFGKI